MSDTNFRLEFFSNTSAGPGGSITPNGAVIVEDEADQTFFMTPETGYHVEDVVVDSISAGAIDTYIFNSVTEDHTIEAYFEIDNRAPVGDPNGLYLGAAGSPIVFDGTGSSDPDSDPLTYDWDWGDGDISLDAGATPSHSYTESSIYDVCLTASDAIVSDTACTYVVVYDVGAGFVTGGGWIDSPAGAYSIDPSLTGKANFGFVSKYKKGFHEPTGQTEFQFHVADLKFHSSSYDWLVVTGNGFAKFKGSDTINGIGDYEFMIWAGDGDPDTFRIKI